MAAPNTKLNTAVVTYYLNGGSRQDAMKEFGLDTNKISHISHRLGLHWSVPPDKRQEHHKQHGRTPGKGTIRRAPVAAPAAPVAPAPRPKDGYAVPTGQRCNIFELTDTMCHWPIGDPIYAGSDSDRFYYCGGRAMGGKSYCAYHLRIAYVPIDIRRRRPVNA
jgi:GcrA cell cycle regulator